MSIERSEAHVTGLELLTFFANNGLFTPPVNGQGCLAGECGYRPLPNDEVAGLLAYLRKL